MPSVGGPHDPDVGRRRADIVLGDCFATTCDNKIISVVEDVFREYGYQVTRNRPFAGGFSTKHYGNPKLGLHALQIEINRALYMDETVIKKNIGMDKMTEDITGIIEALAAIDHTEMLPH